MRKRILILDDDPAVLDILQIMLEDEGFEVFTFEKTDDLIGWVSLHQPDLIILDFCLHGLNGGEWCARLKHTKEFAAIPVMIFTASSKPLAKGSFGCDCFIAKPFDVEDILVHIRQLVYSSVTSAIDKKAIFQDTPEPLSN